MQFLIDNTYWLFWGFALLCAAWFYIRHKKRIRTFLLGSVTGLASLVLLHLYGGSIGFSPSLCRTNILLSVIFGIPGTALAALSEVFLRS